MKRWIAVGAGGLAIVAGITISQLGGDVEAGDHHILIVADSGTLSMEAGEIILAWTQVPTPTPMPTPTPAPAGTLTPTPYPTATPHPTIAWCRCDNPQTQEDIDYCKAKGTGVVFTARTVSFITEAEGNSINARTLRAKVNDTENPTSLITIP